MIKKEEDLTFKDLQMLYDLQNNKMNFKRLESAYCLSKGRKEHDVEGANLSDFPPFENLVNAVNNKDSSIKQVEDLWDKLCDVNTDKYIIHKKLYGGKPVIDTTIKIAFYFDGNTSSMDKIINYGRQLNYINNIFITRKGNIKIEFNNDKQCIIKPRETVVFDRVNKNIIHNYFTDNNFYFTKHDDRNDISSTPYHFYNVEKDKIKTTIEEEFMYVDFDMED